MERKINVIGYCRVSTSDQAENGFSLKVQEDTIRRFCINKNYNLIDVYLEDYTGKNDFTRPKWNQIQTYIKRNKKLVQGIVCLRWDRFSRNTFEAYKTIYDFKRKNIEIITIEEPIDIDSPDGRLKLGILLSFAEAESMKNSLRTRESSRRCRLEGCWTGSAPFGYKNHRTSNGKSTLIPHPAYSKIVHEVFVKYSSGIYSREELWKEYRGKLKMSKNNFVDMFKKVVYNGKIEVAEFYDEPKKIVKGLHNAIIDNELFTKVQNIINGKTRQMEFKKEQLNKFPLKNMVICHEHNRMITASSSKSRNGSYHDYYHCSISSCKNRIKKEVLENIIEEKLKTIQVPTEVVDLYFKALEISFKEKRKGFLYDTRDIEAKMDEVRKKLERTDELFLTQQIEPSDYKRLTNSLNQELNSFQSELIQHKSEKVPYTQLLKKVRHLLPDILEYYKNADGVTKNKILGSMFADKFVIEKGEVRTAKWIPIIEEIMLINNDLGNMENKKVGKTTDFSILAPPSGLEPETL
jgi:site-specific DNA recombinase